MCASEEGSLVKPLEAVEGLRSVVCAQVAGGKDESVMQPVWTSKGQLAFISDRSGWWNLYLETSPGSVKALLPKEAEFGEPAWMFGSRTYTVLSDDRWALLDHIPCAQGTCTAVSWIFTTVYAKLKTAD